MNKGPPKDVGSHCYILSPLHLNRARYMDNSLSDTVPQACHYPLCSAHPFTPAQSEIWTAHLLNTLPSCPSPSTWGPVRSRLDSLSQGGTPDGLHHAIFKATKKLECLLEPEDSSASAGWWTPATPCRELRRGVFPQPGYLPRERN